MTLKRSPSFLICLLASVCLASGAAAATSTTPPAAASAGPSPVSVSNAGQKSNKPSSSKPEQGGSQKAASSGEEKPVEQPDTIILSDTLNYDDVKKESVFTGNVIMTRGLMTLTADTLAMHEDAEGFQYGTATVGPNKLVFVRQENPEKFEVVEARGLRAEYDGKTDIFEMIGQAIVTKFICGKPFDTISGERVKYNQTTNIYEAYGGPNSAAKGGRVRSVAQPRAKADAAAAECQQKAAKSPAQGSRAQ